MLGTVRGDFDPQHPTADDFVWFHRPLEVELSAPDLLGGEIRVTRDGSAPGATSELVAGPLSITQNTRLRAGLFVDGRRVGAETPLNFDRRPARVRVSWFELPRRALEHVPDFSDQSRWTPARIDLLPELRGPYRTARPVGQQLDATLEVRPEHAGTHTFRIQTRDGRARLLVDGVPILGPSEIKLEATLDLAAGPHPIRVQHASGNISPVVIVAHKRPGETRFVEISPRLTKIPRGRRPESRRPPGD